MGDNAMRNLTYGLFVLTTELNGKQNGCIINTCMQVTTDPNKICIVVNKANYSHDILMENGKFNISIISENAKFDLFKRFGFQSGRDVNKFEGFTGFKVGYNGVNYITEGTNAYIAGWVLEKIDLGTHTMFIAAVTNTEVLSDVSAASYDYYHKNIKPKPENTKNTDKSVFRCTICGYEYEGDNLPDDYICPLCKHPASDFEKV